MKIWEFWVDDYESSINFKSLSSQLRTEYTFADVEEYYYYKHGKLLNIKSQLTSEASLNSSRDRNDAPQPNFHKMPIIPVPKFNGKHAAWKGYKNMFKALVFSWWTYFNLWA